MFLRDLDLPVGPPLDHRGVIGIDQACLGMQVLDRLVIGVRVAGVVIHPDIGQERVHCHRQHLQYRQPGRPRYRLRGQPARQLPGPVTHDPGTQCVSVAGGLNGILNVLLAFL